MNLKKIEVYGFKSFADKLEMKFDKPITAIVGPNGCGKKQRIGCNKVGARRAERQSFARPKACRT